MPEPIEVDIRLTVQDLFLVRLLQFTRKPIIVALLGVVMVLLFGLFVVSIVIYHDPNYLVFAEFCLIGVLIPTMLFLSTRRYYRSAKHVQEPLHYRLSSSELRANSAHYQTVLELDHAWKIQETREYFLVWETPQAAHVLPKRSFRNSTEVAALRTLFSAAHPVEGVRLVSA